MPNEWNEVTVEGEVFRWRIEGTLIVVRGRPGERKHAGLQATQDPESIAEIVASELVQARRT